MEDLGIDQKFIEPKAERKLDQVAGSYTYFADGDVLLAKITPCFENGKLGIARGLTNGVGFGSSEYIVFRPSDDLSNEYLYYFFLQNKFRAEGIRTMSGAVGHKRVSKEFIERCQILLPPLPEQQRIVAILDEAFAGLATATANAEKNLENARGLFESYLSLVFTKERKGWDASQIGDIAEVFDGPHATPKTVEVGPVFLGISALKDGVVDLSETRHVTAEDFKKWTRRVKPCADDVVFSYETRLGQAAIIPLGLECCLGRRMGLVRCDRSKIEPRFFLYQYLAKPFQDFLRSRTVRGATVDRISIKEFPEFEVRVPPLDEQRQIVAALDRFAENRSALEDKCRRKLRALDDLKQSILQKAFSGELTSARIAAPTKQPIAIAGISPTDLHAGIIAIAYQKHQGHPKQNTFGHVKAEKIAHMVEARVGIDLGRNPMKDAAGPNDYPHLMRVEHRANMASYFSVKRLAHGPYAFSKKNRFEEIIRKSRHALGEYNQAIDAVIDMMLPMDTEQAEIFATVFAAWNNLLLDGQSPDDETIVREARENWHPDKLEINRRRFFTALEWMKKNNVAPKGEGKKVIERTTG